MSDTYDPAKGKELTGRKFLAIMVTGFGIIITVNLIMAYSAVSTFPGLVVKNGYIASQTFDRERAAQEALGLQVAALYDGKDVRITVASLAAVPVGVADLQATVGRPTHDRDDIRLDLVREGQGFVAPADLGTGAWVIRLKGVASNGTAFRQDLGLGIRR